MLAKFAILDIVVTTCIGFSVMFGFLTQFVSDKNKKYMWWMFYIFSGLAVMAKGIPGFIVPFAIMFLLQLPTKLSNRFLNRSIFCRGLDFSF